MAEKSVDKFSVIDDQNYEVHTSQKNHILPTANPDKCVEKSNFLFFLIFLLFRSKVFMHEFKSYGKSAEGQRCFISESTKSLGRSDDPKDFANALDSVFAANPSGGVFNIAWSMMKKIHIPGNQKSRGNDQVEGSAASGSQYNQNQNQLKTEKEEYREPNRYE